MTVAGVDDVAAALMRPLEADELPFVQSMLDYVEACVDVRVPDALPRALVEDSYRVVLTRVEAEACCRVLRAPGGGLYKYETEGTYTYSVNYAVASGLLGVSEAEWELLEGGPSAAWAGGLGETDAYARARYGDAAVSGVGVWSLSYPRGVDTPARDFIGRPRGWRPW